MAAPVLVAALALGGPLALVSRPIRILFGLLLFAYAAATLLASLHTASRSGWRLLPRLPVIFATMHLSWGAGFWAGVLREGMARLRTAAGVISLSLRAMHYPHLERKSRETTPHPRPLSHASGERGVGRFD